MAFRKVKSFLFRCSVASIVGLTFVSCQPATEDSGFGNFWPQEESSQKVVIPASFTEAKAVQLCGQLDSIFTYLHKKRGFNGTVLVTKYDQVIYKNAFGYADFYHKDPLGTQTAFQLASVSKQFTAMAIMMLKEEGKLNYDDSVQQYLPAFPYKGITVRQLLTHRSGLPNYTYFSDKLWPSRKLPMTNEDVVNLMVQHHPKIFYKPDTHFDYSNTGYALLASIVTEASGVPFTTYLQEHIFEPLQMTHTFTYNNLAAQTGSVATGHTGNRQMRTTDHLDTVLGDKGMYSTVEDLYKWDQALYTQKLVKSETLAEAFTGSRTEKKKDEDYGFGWRIKALESGDTAVYHAGLWHGYTNYLLRNPKDHSAIIILSNFPNGSLKYLKELRHFLYPAAPVMIANNKDKQSKPASARL